MSKTYLADKQTLDTVNTKVGASSDAESSTPATLFAGLKNIIKGITEIKKSASDGKTKVAGAITGKGISTAADATFTTMANNINAIITLGQGTADANATAAQILSGRTAYVNGSKITGTIPSIGANYYTPTTYDQTIWAGQYLSGNQTIAGSGNLVPGNIKQGVNIFGITGTLNDFASDIIGASSVHPMYGAVNGYNTWAYDVTITKSGSGSSWVMTYELKYPPKFIIISHSVNSNMAFCLPGSALMRAGYNNGKYTYYKDCPTEINKSYSIIGSREYYQFASNDCRVIRYYTDSQYDSGFAVYAWAI